MVVAEALLTPSRPPPGLAMARSASGLGVGDGVPTRRSSGGGARRRTPSTLSSTMPDHAGRPGPGGTVWRRPGDDGANFWSHYHSYRILAPRMIARGRGLHHQRHVGRRCDPTRPAWRPTVTDKHAAAVRPWRPVKTGGHRCHRLGGDASAVQTEGWSAGSPFKGGNGAGS